MLGSWGTIFISSLPTSALSHPFSHLRLAALVMMPIIVEMAVMLDIVPSVALTALAAWSTSSLPLSLSCPMTSVGLPLCLILSGLGCCSESYLSHPDEICKCPMTGNFV